MIESSPRQRVLVLAICCMSLLIVSLDNTVLNVALPSMRRDLDASVSGLQWSIDAYTLVLASLLMLAGSTADRIGRRKVFVAGLVAFTVGSLLCSLAPSLDWLIVFRMVQAVGGAMLNPVAMSIITNTFTDPAERARAIGVWGAVGGISMAAGPLIGGVLVDSVGWRSIFLINLPIGLAAFALTLRHIPESRAARPRRPDPLGQVLVIALLGSLTYGIIEAPAAGWRSPLIMGCAVVAFASSGTLGVAVIGSVLAAGLAHGSDFSAAAQPAWWIITLCGLLVLVVGAATSGTWARATASGPPAPWRSRRGKPPRGFAARLARIRAGGYSPHSKSSAEVLTRSRRPRRRSRSEAERPAKMPLSTSSRAVFVLWRAASPASVMATL
ncbi:MFS transporter [Streptomyces avidinii]